MAECGHPDRAPGGGVCDLCDQWYGPKPCWCGRPNELVLQPKDDGSRALEIWLSCPALHAEYLGETRHPAGRALR